MPSKHSAQPGDLAYLVGPRGQTFTVQLKPGEQLHSMHGILSHDALIGVVWGSQVETHLGKRFTLLQPAFEIGRSEYVRFWPGPALGFRPCTICCAISSATPRWFIKKKLVTS